MQAVATNKEAIIKKFDKHITLSEQGHNNWRIGTGSLQRASLLNVSEEIIFLKCAMDEAAEIMFNFIAQGVRTCNMSKSNQNGIYLYR